MPQLPTPKDAMTAPTVTVTTDRAVYTPGELITVTWTVSDDDNTPVTISWRGTDIEGNAVEGTLTVERREPFTMTRIWWVDGGDFVIDPDYPVATSVVPGA
jgi:hypothetical protein